MEGIAGIGDVLFTNETLLTPWFPRAADNAVFTVELIFTIGSTLDVKVYHKNSEDTGDGSNSTAGTFTGLTAAGLGVLEVTDLKEMVRFEVKATSGTALRYRFLDTTWFNKADA